MDPIDYLFSLEFHGIKLGLDNITDLLNQLENPQNTYPTIHVGGTNGKGSTIAFLDHMLRASGYKVGRFTSPHLCELNERFMINGVPISSNVLRDITENIAFHAKQFDSPPTFFEANTAIAFEYFKLQKVDVALIEVGMGGRFDSTNVIEPVASIITNIALEHTQYLGNTVEKIAFEKAGIIKKEVPVIVGNLSPEATIVIEKQAESLNAPMLSYDSNADWTIGESSLPLAGGHQADNARLALATAKSIHPHFPKLSLDTALEGIRTTCWPCRMENVLSDPLVIVDVAHNPAGIDTLIKSLENDAIFILSVSTDKDAAAMIHAVSKSAEHIIFTQFDGHRATPIEALAIHCADSPPHTSIHNFEEAIDQGIILAKKTGAPLIITGSIFTAGQARSYLVQAYQAPPMQF